MIFGGFDRKSSILNDIWVMNSDFSWTQLFSAHPSIPPGLAHAAMYLNNGILVRLFKPERRCSAHRTRHRF
jgi:hypothetical protein